MNKGDFKDNPELYSELKQIMDALFCMDFRKYLGDGGFGWKDAEVVHAYHYKSFLQKRLMPMVKKKGGIFPREDKTKAITEFIARGFIHKDDIRMSPDKHWVICNIAPLVWPEGFDTHQEAIDIQMRMGISGYTGTTLKK